MGPSGGRAPLSGPRAGRHPGSAWLLRRLNAKRAAGKEREVLAKKQRASRATKLKVAKTAAKPKPKPRAGPKRKTSEPGLVYEPTVM